MLNQQHTEWGLLALSSHTSGGATGIGARDTEPSGMTLIHVSFILLLVNLADLLCLSYWILCSICPAVCPLDPLWLPSECVTNGYIAVL